MTSLKMLLAGAVCYIPEYLDPLVALETRFVYYSRSGLYSKFLRYQKQEELTAITLHDYKELNVELNVVKISM